MAKLALRLWKHSQQWTKDNARIFLTAGSVSAVVIGLRFLGLLQIAELSALDVLLNIRPMEPKDDRIRIVTIDQPDLNNYGWPFPDGVVAEALEKIQAQEPAVIGFDLVRDRPVGTGAEQLKEEIQATPNFVGIEVLNAMPEFYTEALPYMWREDRDGNLTKGVGFNNLILDVDGVVRRNLLFWKFDGEVRQSFALQIAQEYLEDQKRIVGEGYPPEKPRYLKLGDGIFSDLKDTHSLYGWLDRGENYQILSNMSHPDRFEHISFSAVMNGRVPPNFFRNRIVLIGSVAENTKDLFVSPFSNKLQGTISRIGGVEIHASFTSEILGAAMDNRPLLKPFSFGQDVVWIVVSSLLGSAVIWRWRSPIRGGIALGITTLSILGLTYILFITSGWLVPVAPALLSLLGAAGVVTIYLAHQERELSRSKEFFHLIIDNIPDPVFVKDGNYNLTVVNDAFCQLIGRPQENIIGKSDYDLFNHAEAQAFHDQDKAVLESSTPQENEESLTSFDGENYLIATKRSLHKDTAGNLFLVGVIRDITERKKLEAELRRTAEELSRSNNELKASEKRLRHLANHDPLTGLPNRKLFNEKLNQLLEWGEENQQLVSLLFLDLDGFKPVNDNLGHDMGDVLLKAVAQRIKNSLRISDVVSRLGGDEFTVLLPGIKKPLDSKIVAQKILDTVSAPYTLQGHRIQVTVSIGISVYPLDGDNAGDLIKLADQSMYEAKRSGRNQYKMTQSLMELSLEAEDSDVESTVESGAN